MGTPLTGSSVASTYTGLLKNSDNSTVGASLKAISDGSGNDSALQISNAAVNTTGDFSVATNKLTVASASGNTAVAGTLAVTGATNLSSLITSGAATIGGALNVTGATTLTGNLTVPGNLAVTGTSTLTGATAVTGTLGVAGASTLASVGVTGAATVGTTLGVTGAATVGTTLMVTGATTLGTVGASTANISTLNVSGLTTVAELDNLGDSTIGGTLDVTGATTLGGLTVAGNLAANGNTTLGNASGDSLTVTAGAVTINNLPSKTVPVDADTVLLRDSAASNALKTASIGTIGAVKFVYSEEIVKPSTTGQFMSISSGVGTAIQESGSTSDWSYTWTPKTVGNKALIKVSVPFQPQNDGICYVGIAQSPYAQPGDIISASGVYGESTSFNTMSTNICFVSTVSTYTFKILVTSNQTMGITVAANTGGSYFNQSSSTFHAKVHFELIEFA
jgi:fibronectin-binding autotransporter adhesin